uniref:Amino acid transporter transmembrane domain-containing protein n=1 Tax=Chromera velia CCMP2878 TaxID=1169474 RepID=A0A0G4HD08_9ALVE|eukprot:Cvel_6347.t1-p1 / transcript=Cvel_6347.t1 / gene=Cvel_6347 / organism=Chromera_velia_CCMP2878 / gene_product=hypothetical protein / transcript_product=hypothetical protein / location=Cvel_scaffold308:76322-83467(+) / protein_length=634 / sequence_SO=supercontig / SO=protein_coding / is_pseudo=false
MCTMYPSSLTTKAVLMQVTGQLLEEGLGSTAPAPGDTMTPPNVGCVSKREQGAHGICIDGSTTASENQSTAHQPRPLALWEAALHLIKGNLGPGLIAMPLQFAIVGPGVGLCVLALVALQGLFCMWLLVKTQQRAMKCRAVRARLHSSRSLSVGSPPSSPQCGSGSSSPSDSPVAALNFESESNFNSVPSITPTPLTFEDLGCLAFGGAGRFAVESFILGLQLGICSIYISLVAENLMKPLPGGYVFPFVDRWHAVLSAYVPCLLLSLLPDLSGLWPISTFGTCAMLLALGSAAGAAIYQLTLVGEMPALMPSGPSDSHRPLFLSFASCAAATFYAFEGMSIVIPIGNAVDKALTPRYPSIVLGAMGFVAVFFAVVAAVTAMAFPELAGEDEASITAFLASRYAGTDTVGTFFASCNLVVTAAVLATFPLQLTPAAFLLDSKFRLTSLHARLLSRILITTFCCLLVLLVEDLAVLINLVGAVTNTALALLPAVIHARFLLALPGFRDADTAAVHSHSGVPERPRSPSPPSASLLEPLELEAPSAESPDRLPPGTGSANPLMEHTAGPRPSELVEGPPQAVSHERPFSCAECLSLLADGVVVVFCVGLMVSGVAAEAWALAKHHEGAEHMQIARL